MGCQVQAGALSLGVLTRDRSQQVGKCGQALVGVTDLGVWGRVGAGWSPGSGARVTVAIPCQSAHWPLARLWGCRGKQRWARVAGMGHRQPQALTLARFSGLPLLSPGHPSGQLASPASPPAPKLTPQWPAFVFCLIERKKVFLIIQKTHSCAQNGTRPSPSTHPLPWALPASVSGVHDVPRACDVPGACDMPGACDVSGACDMPRAHDVFMEQGWKQ